MVLNNRKWHIKYTHTNAANDDFTILGHVPLANRIEQVTGEQVKITLEGAEKNIKSDQIWGDVVSGKSDMGWIYTGLYPGRFSFIEVSTLPFLYPDAIVGSQVTWRLFDRFPALASQFKAVKVFSVWITEPYFIAGRSRFYKKLDDFKGQKIRTALGPPSLFVKEMGAAPVTVVRNEVNRAFEKGEIDAALLPAEAYLAFRTYDLAPFVTRVATVATVNALVMNLETWASFPCDIQERIMSAGGENGAVHFGCEVFDKSRRDMQKVIDSYAAKIQEYRLPEDERQVWIEKAGRPVWQAWVGKQKEAGLSDADRILEEARQMSAAMTV